MRITLTGRKSILASFFCATIFFFSFLFPVLQMLYWTISFPKHLEDLNLIRLLLNSLLLVFLSSLVLIFFSFISNYGNRVTKSRLLEILNTFSISGYAIPGIILAVSFITFISWFDNNVINFFELKTIKTVFIGSVLGLIIVYFIRFYSLASNGIKSGYLKINYSIDESAYLLGYSKFKTFFTVHIPYLKNSIFLIGILISI
jgi:iron(III) transport system permease protein